MMHQLYIDGMLADMSDNTEVTLTLVSNLLTGAASFKGNRSLTIKLPSTVHNRNIIEQADKVHGGGNTAYEFHDIEYRRDGVPVIRGGVGRLMSADTESIDIAITWGVRSSVDGLLQSDQTLNDISTNAAITFNQTPSLTDYADALTDDVFYAALDCFRHESENDYYRLHVTFCGDTWDTSDLGSASSFLHPSVRMNWILSQLSSMFSMTFDWNQDAQDYIDTMIVPLVTKIPNDITWNYGFTTSMSDFGPFGSSIPLKVTKASAIMSNTLGQTYGTLTCANAFTGMCKFTIYFYINEADLLRVAYPLYRVRSGYFIRVTASGQVHDCVLIPENTDVLDSDIAAGRINFYATGYIPLDMDAADTLQVSVGNIVAGVKDANTYTGLHIQGGALFISEIIGSDNEVQPSTQFPVEGNLPDIKCIDLIKFLCAVTGTFPVQASTATVLSMRPVSDLFDWSRAEDWSDRVLSTTSRPVAANIAYTLDDWAKRNWYRWKEDETVRGQYDGFIEVADETIEEDRDIMDFPFAATDGNNVPMYVTEDNKTKWSKVEPRVLRMESDGNGKAVGFFDMDVPGIINSRYIDLVSTLSKTVVITETLRMNDVQFALVDETKPVYLKQHASYFALLELTLKNDGLAEAKFLKLTKTEE